MNIKTKLLAALLIFVFVASISAAVAEDSADADQLAVDDVNDAIAVDEDDDTVSDEEDGEDEDAVGASPDDEDSDLTSLAITAEVLDKNPKAGDNVRVRVTVTNWGDNPADNVLAGFGFLDMEGNPDVSFRLVDDGGYDVSEADGGYEIDFGFLGAGESQDVILTFLATEAGTKQIVAIVTSDNSILEPDSMFNTTVTVGENPQSKAKAASSAKSLPATGNPLALLALSLFCLVPYCRRK